MHQTTPFRTALLGGIAGIGLLGLTTTAQATTLAFYDFESGRDSTDTDPFSVASAMRLESDIALIDVGAGAGNPGSAVHSITRFGTLGDAKFYDTALSMTLAPKPGFAMNLQFLDTDMAAHNLNSNNFTAQLFVFSSLDNYASPIHFNLASDATPSATAAGHGAYSSVSSNGMLVNPNLYENVTTPVEFHFVFLGTSAQVALLDNVRISGTMAVLPEPAAFATAGAALLLAARRRRPA